MPELMETIKQTQQSPRVLVVDDEKVIREILYDFLKSEGYEVITAVNGREALDRLVAEHFDVVITDLKMPEMGGMELIDEIQKRQLQVSTIMMTGYATLETAIESMKRGAFDYVQKPFKMSDILAVVTRCIQQRIIEKENVQLRELTNLYKVSEAMSSTLTLSEILAVIMDTIMKEIEADAVSLHHLDQNDSWHILAQGAAEGLDGSGPELFGTPHYSTMLSSFESQSHILIDGKGAGSLFEELPERKDLSSFLAVPLNVKARTIGLICCYSYTPGRHFLEGQSQIMSILASRAASAIENAQLYEQLQQALQETIQGLVTALEAKDPYTSGHTKRVTQYAVMIARGMGLDNIEIEKIRRASLLHDIGKIGIRLESLNKSDALSMDEYEMFKEHPTQSRQILEPIQFLNDIVPMVEAHHERWDGFGYPNELKGEEIPLGARILAVADSFDAMTSDRPYRRALSRKKALEELRANKGTQFDPELVDIFIKELQKS